ncbi:MAG: type II secretion system protein [Candidatus Spechtbacterales bacterium]|nr:type II secretion system protein [Candidatus Spechtbacterales bacterium]
MQIFTKKSKGFTLIELLVVIAIIGILATIVLVSLNDAREKARDTKRVGDLRQAQIALEVFLDDNAGGYPTGADDGCTTGNADTMFTAVGMNGFADPLNSAPYQYTYDSDGTNTAGTDDATDYVIMVQLEGDTHQALVSDLDGSIDFAPAGAACDCGTNDDVAGNTPVYCVGP